jgi:hypothetical protein
MWVDYKTNKTFGVQVQSYVHNIYNWDFETATNDWNDNYDCFDKQFVF